MRIDDLLDDVKRGEFERIPKDLKWQEGWYRLIWLIDCYYISSIREIAADYHLALDEYDKTHEWQGDALRLWKLLFFATQAYRFTMRDPSGIESAEEIKHNKSMDALARALREALVNLSAAERFAIMELFEGPSILNEL